MLLVDELKLDLTPMKHMPTLAAFRNGWCSWVHGTDAVEVMKEKLPDFDTQAELQMGR